MASVVQSLTLTQQSQSIDSNYSVVRILWTSTQDHNSYNNNTRTAKYYVTINGVETEYSVSYTLPKNTTKTILDTTIVVPHNNDGTGAVSVRTWMDTKISAGVVTKTASLTLTTIPRKSTLSVGNGTLGEPMTLTINKQASGFTSTITYSCGGTNRTICDKISGTSVSWTPPIELASMYPNANSVSITLTITTYNGSTLIGSSSVPITCAIPYSHEFIPVLLPTITDATGYSTKLGGWVQGQSRVKVDITTYGAYGASIASVKTEFEGATYTGTSVTTNAISKSGILQIKITVTDSRGRVTAVTPEISVMPYEYPKVTSLTATRCNEDGSKNPSGAYLLVKFSASMSSLNYNNTAKYYIGYKKISEADHTAIELTDLAGQYSVNSSYVIPAETTSSYTVIFTVIDAFVQARTTTTGASAKKVWSLMKKNGEIVGMAFNKVAEHEGYFDVGMPIKINGGGDCVVEQGQKDGWIYRKWNSGIMECWKIYEFSTTISTAFGSLYCGNATARQEYPFPFKEKPVENVTLQSGSTQAFLYVETAPHGVNGVSSSARYNVFRPGAMADSQTFYLSFHVIGKWK